MMMLKQLMMLVVLEQATADKVINNTRDILEQVAVGNEMNNKCDVFQQAVVGKEVNIRNHVLEQVTTLKAINNTSNALEQVPVGKEIKNINDVCSLSNIIEFKDKNCANLVNSTYIVNIKFFNIIVVIFVKATENYAVTIEHNAIALCKQVHDSVHIISSSVTACNDEAILPEELDLNKIEHEYRDICNTLVPIQYTVLGIFMLAGITMNVLLIVIFIRHKNSRTDPILINLAVADIFNLAVNMPMKILIREYEILCLKDILHLVKIFIICSRVPIFISEYSLVTISYQRFKAVFSKTEIQNRKKVSNFVKITVLCLLGILYGALYLTVAIIADNSEWAPLDLLISITLYISFFIEGVIPGILVTVFSLLASRKLKKLAENFPGERTHHLQLIQDRYLTAKTLIVLVVLFLITCIPQKIILNVVINHYIKVENKTFFELLRDQFKLLYVKLWISIIEPVYSVLNPVVLYFLSPKFRRYFNSYLHCRSHELD